MDSAPSDPKPHILAEELQILSRVGVWEYDFLTQKSQFSNQIYKIHGLEPGAPAGSLEALEHYTDRDRNRLQELFNECRKGKSFRDIFEIKNSRGEQRWVEVTAHPVFNDEGLLVKIKGTQQDVTEAHKLKQDLQSKVLELERTKAERQALLDWSPAAVYECKIDQDWTMIYVSSHIDAISGYSAEDFIENKTLSFGSLIHPEDVAAVDEAVESSIERNSFYDVTYRILSKSGEIRWVWDRGSLSKRSRTLIGVLLDVTETRRTQDLLQEAQRIAKIGSWEYNLVTGKVIATTELFRIFDLPSDLPTGKLIAAFESQIHPEDKKRVATAMDRCLKRKESVRVEYRVTVMAGKQQRHVLAILNPILDPTGEAIGLSGTCQDVTDRVEREEENQYVLRALGIGIWKYKPHTRELWWDQSMYRLYGIDESKFSGHVQAWESTLTEKAKPTAVKELEMAIRGDKEFNTTFEITKEGQVRHIGARGRVIRNSLNEPIVMYGINWDRTHEVLLEQKLEIERQKSIHTGKMASLGEMSAGIAHEINNPLAIISGTVELLKRRGAASLDLEEKLDKISRAAERISRIVGGLRRFSRTSGPADRSPQCLAELLNEVLVLTEPRAKKEQVRIEIKCSCSLPININPIEIEQVLINLINNGIDAARSARVARESAGTPSESSSEAWVRIEAFEQSSSVCLRVCDSGSGVPDHLVDRIFEPFFTTKPVGEGTGLGLSISESIVEQHGGTIRYDKGQGFSCFEIQLPVHPK